jgi:putative heme iron utilization protein
MLKLEVALTNDAHARPSGEAAAPLYDLNVPTPSHAERARTMVAQLKTGTLCTIAIDPAGYPYGSFVTVAFEGGNPVFLISEMAEHTRNLRHDARASLLVAEGGAIDPLANGRVTLIGACKPTVEPNVRAAFLEEHPNASYYVDFKDFSFWKLEVASVRYIGGYGRMSWVAREDWQEARPDPLAAHAAQIIAHMNEDHRDAMLLCARALTHAKAASDASMTSVDRYGFEMSVGMPEGPRPVRLAFASPVTAVDEARAAVIEVVRHARMARD